MTAYLTRLAARAARTATLAVAFLQVPTALAQEPVHVLATDWGLTLKSDGTGFYNDLAQLLLVPEIGPVDYEALPYKRAMRQMQSDMRACIYPSSIPYLAAGEITGGDKGLISSKEIIRAQTHIFSRYGTAPPTRPADLDGKRVAYPHGSATLAYLKGVKAMFIAVPDEVDKAEMLLNGRVDLLMADLPDADFVFRSLDAKLPPFDPAFVVRESTNAFVCHATSANRTFISQLNARYDALLANGQLAAFFVKNGLDPKAHIAD